MQIRIAAHKPLDRSRLRGPQTRTQVAKCATPILNVVSAWPPSVSIGRKRSLKSLFHDNLSHGSHVIPSVPSVDKSTLSSLKGGSQPSEVPVQPLLGARYLLVMGHAHQGWLPSGGVMSQRLIGSFLLLTFLMLGVSLLFLEDLRVSLRQVLTGSSAASGLRPTISGTVQPASALRCNRLSLPASYYNESQGPYNPAAVRHPVSREWLLLYTYDEVRDVPQRLSCRL